MAKPDVIYKNTIQLIASAHEGNPRVHTWDSDLPKLARSLLFSGWCELPSYNAANDRVIGGHGRILVSEWLMQQTKEYFTTQYQEYLQVNPTPSGSDRERFKPGFWTKIPVKVSSLNDSLHKAMMVRLNNSGVRGRTKEEIQALLLSRMPAAAAEIAIPDPEKRSRLLQGVQAKQAERAPQQAVQEQERQTDQWRVVESIAEVREAIAQQLEQPEPIASVFTPDRPLEPDPEPEIGEGGAHYNEDPKPGERKQVMYPLAIVISDRRWQQWQQWKAEAGFSSDQAAFLRGHLLFKPQPQPEESAGED